MKHCLPRLVLILLIPFAGIAQYPRSFTLVINFPQSDGNALHTGESYFFEEYSAANFDSDSAVFQKGKYVFNGTLLYPTAIRLWGKSGKQSFNQFMFIDAGYQEITLTRLDSAITISSRSKSSIEQDYQTFLKKLGIVDIDKEMPLEKLHTFIAANPHSYVALFALLTQTFDFGYKPETRAIASQLGPKLQDAKGYRYFAERHLVQKKLLPLNLANAEGGLVKVEMSNNDGKYTFIELWYTGCYACVVSMDDLKKKKKNGSFKKVRIISVNTDTDSISKESIALMDKLKAPWVNYWDLDGKELGQYMDKLSFAEGAQSIYPTNVLVDNNGYIIARDIDVYRIDDFISYSATIKVK